MNYNQHTPHDYWMTEALRLASKARGWVSPNPPVGAILVKDEKILGMGWTQPPGGDHAEKSALKHARYQGYPEEGATLYSTLEPCCHYGKTPPCTDAIIESGVKQVVLGVRDPNPLVDGKGVSHLTKAGVHVIEGVLSKRITLFYRAFFWWMEHKTPWVTAKYAMTWDGRLASNSGDARWITGLPARRNVHRLRHLHDGIVVGVNTVIHDDPSLTVRLVKGTDPIRIVLDPAGRIPPYAKLLMDEMPTWVVTKPNPPENLQKSLQERNNALIIENSPDKTIKWQSLLKELGERNLTSILIEGGGYTLGTAMKARVVNEIIVYVAPKIVGGTSSTLPFWDDFGNVMDDAISITLLSRKKLGADVRLHGLIDYARST